MKIIKKLFLIDDDEVFTFLTKRTIDQTNLVDEVTVFSNGQDALDFLEKSAEDKDMLPEIILLDIHMPVLDGWGFLEEYILMQPAMARRITIYVVSTSISRHDFERVKRIAEVSDYILKPITKPGLIKILEDAV